MSVVPLPNDEMKGRIIGREGRNIRTLETLTGVDLIIDDTPEAITVSCFDPVRREIARIALEQLITGRPHPPRPHRGDGGEGQARGGGHHQGRGRARRAWRPMSTACTRSWSSCWAGMRYRTSYGQNVLNHSIEVSHLAGLLAAELGADVTDGQARRSAPRSGQVRWTTRWRAPTSRSASSWPASTRRAKRSSTPSHAHHNDVEPQTIVACLVQAADAISAARPGARRENVENYIKRLEKLEEISTSLQGRREGLRHSGRPRDPHYGQARGDQTRIT